MNSIKKNGWYLGILGIVVVLGIIFFLSQKNTISQVDTQPSQLFAQCYEYKQETISSEGEPAVNREFVGFTPDADQISGIHLIEPHGQEPGRASLVGAIDGDFINAIASVSVLDSSWQEQRLYKIDADRLYVGYEREPKPRVKNNDVYYYADINNIAFDTPEFFLDAVPCE